MLQKEYIFALYSLKKHLKMIRRYSYLTMLLVLSMLAIACEKDDPEPPNEEELITTVTYQLVADGGATVEMSFVDLDGDGGDAPTIVGGTLAANTIYTGSITLLNEIENPTEDITLEVREEDDEHQLFFETNIAGLTVDYRDEDGNGRPLGLETTVTTGAAGQGTLTVTLRHEPAKDADGVANGLIANAGGETDIEVAFPVNVE